jgi:Holliday junction resolvase
MSALTPEGKVKRMVTLDSEEVQRCGISSPAANGMGRAGIPDIIAIVAGDFVGIEVKADKTKKPTELQKICGKEIQAAGGFWFLVYDEDSCD